MNRPQQHDLFAAQEAAAHERKVRQLVAGAKRAWQDYAEAVTERLQDGAIEKSHAIDLLRSKLQRESKKFFAHFPFGWLGATALEGQIWEELGPGKDFARKVGIFFPPQAPERKAVVA